MTHTAYISHPDCLLHDSGPHHPERADRLHAVRNALLDEGLMEGLHLLDAPPATDAQLQRVHTPAHVARIRANAPALGHHALLDPDTAMGEHSLQAALRAAGAGIEGVRAVMEEDVDNAFCAIRPPGHHAERDRAMGFCLFNNIAVAAAHALEHYALSRVAIADFDVHHGNGTEDIFRDDPRVLYCSSFQHPFYPDTPRAERDHLIHTPLAAGTTGAQFRAAVRHDWLPALEQFRPQLVLVSAGFDAHQDDALAGLNLDADDFSWITHELTRIAARYAGARLVSMLEGGYALPALGRSAAAHVRALCEAPRR
ncbi:MULTISPECIES: histone deacetylase family protein [unclassified Thioalkalivibrio]|uniref:histone deacetylase family protein n=1 Tax=unclassified Thioalkalivibrio TaxID=2621013 RepID=UPI000362FA10|nr:MULTISPECIES: histone deacetylase family protein [unclassified Thioalkalivibrio]